MEVKIIVVQRTRGDKTMNSKTNNTARIIGATALGLGIAVAIPVLGHGYGGGMHGPGGYGPGSGHHMDMHYGQMQGGAYMEKNLGTLKGALNLTTEQQPAWDQYEQAIKTMIDSHPRWGKTPGDAESHFAQMEQHFAQMKTVFEARKALYETLTDQQKETLNNTMPGPYGHHFGYSG